MLTDARNLIEKSLIRKLSKAKSVKFIISEDRTEESPLLESETRIERWEVQDNGVTMIWFADGSSVLFQIDNLMWYQEKLDIWIQAEDFQGRYFTVENLAA